MLGVFGLSEEQGNEIIMAARAHWFEDEDRGPAAAPPQAPAEPLPPTHRRPPMRTPHNERVTSAKADHPQDPHFPGRRKFRNASASSQAKLPRATVDPASDFAGRTRWGGAGTARPVGACARAGVRGLAFRGPSWSCHGFRQEAANCAGHWRGPSRAPSWRCPKTCPTGSNGLEPVLCDRLGLEMRAGKLILGTDRIAEQADRAGWRC